MPRLAGGRLLLLSDPAFADFAGGSFAAAPQIDPLIVSDAGGHALRVDRVASAAQFQVSYFDLASDPQLAALAEPVRAAVKRMHSYTTPAILVLPIEWVDPDYSAWIMAETNAS